MARAVEHHSAGALVFMAGRVLVLRRNDREEWVFPKGHLETGETAEHAAIREVREEAGIDVRLSGALGWTEYTFRHGRRQHHKHVDWFLAALVAGEVTLEPLFCEWRLVDEPGVSALLTHPEDRETAARAFEALRSGMLPPVAR